MRFDRFADGAAEHVARPWFFMACVLLVVVWAPSLLAFRDLDVWQLLINTATTIVTFLLVALLHNSQHRFETATNRRLQALLEAHGVEDPVADPGQQPEG